MKLLRTGAVWLLVFLLQLSSIVPSGRGIDETQSGRLFDLPAASAQTSAPSRLLGWETNAANVPIGSPITNRLVVVNPATGGTTPLADWPSGEGLGTGSLTVDSMNKRISALGTSRLITFDIQTGALVSQPTLPTQPFQLGALAYEGGTGRLLGWETNAANVPIGSPITNRLVVVNPATGGTTPLADWPSGHGLGGGLTVDSANRRISGLGFGRLFTFDTQSGALVSQPTLSTQPFQLGALAYE